MPNPQDNSRPRKGILARYFGLGFFGAARDLTAEVREPIEQAKSWYANLRDNFTAALANWGYLKEFHRSGQTSEKPREWDDYMLRQGLIAALSGLAVILLLVATGVRAYVTWIAAGGYGCIMIVSGGYLIRTARPARGNSKSQEK